MSGDNMVCVNISSMCIASDIVIAEYNQAELKQRWRCNSEQCLVTKALGRATGMTRLKIRVENPAISRLGELSE